MTEIQREQTNSETKRQRNKETHGHKDTLRMFQIDFEGRKKETILEIIPFISIANSFKEFVIEREREIIFSKESIV